MLCAANPKIWDKDFVAIVAVVVQVILLEINTTKILQNTACCLGCI